MKMIRFDENDAYVREDQIQSVTPRHLGNGQIVGCRIKLVDGGILEGDLLARKVVNQMDAGSPPRHP